MHLERFQSLKLKDIREIVREHGPTTCGFVINGTRRWYMLEHHTKEEDFSSEYLETINARTIEIIQMFYDHGIRNIVMPIISPHILQKRSEAYSKMAKYALEQLTIHPQYLSFYEENNIQIGFYGDLESCMDQPSAERFQANIRAIRKESYSGQERKLFWGIGGHDSTDTIARLSIEYYRTYGTVPDKEKLIELYYGEEIAPLDIYISSSKPRVFDIPLISNGRESLYFTVAPSPYLTKKQFRTILHDHIYHRNATQKNYVVDDHRREQNWRVLREFYRHNQESTLGIGRRSEAGVWLPLPQVETTSSVVSNAFISFENGNRAMPFQIVDEIGKLLRKTGPGHNTITAYDTAWVARLKDQLPDIARDALAWLRQNQLADGSWGMANSLYHHDRVLCTLAAIIALRMNNDIRDRDRVAAGLFALHDHIELLQNDLAGPTVGFEMIFPTLFEEAIQIGILPPIDEEFLVPLKEKRRKKIEMTPNGLISRKVTMAHSAELAGLDGQTVLAVDDLLEPNGSVSLSPSATAYFLLNIKPNHPDALAYIRSAWNNGLPNFAPFDLFEQSWVVWNLTQADLSKYPEIDELVRGHLDNLAQNWQPGSGIGFSRDFSPKDGDDSSLAFDSLIRYGYKIPVDDLFTYEEEYHFRTFDLETHASVGTNVHMLGALLQAGYVMGDPKVEKIHDYLKATCINGQYWVDKWHISPYYITSHVIMTYAMINPEFARPSVDWIIETQSIQGGWGWQQLTAEETAYCLQALVRWSAQGFVVPQSVIQKGLEWLLTHVDEDYPPLWTAKCLYSPKLVVKSAVLSAILMVHQLNFQGVKTPEDMIAQVMS